MRPASAVKLHILLAASLSWAAHHWRPPTYSHRDPATLQMLQCEQCPPGKAVRSHCTAGRPTVCVPCPAGRFSEHWHWGDTCQHCTGVCKEKQLVRRECNGTHDRLCECAPGYHLEVEFCVHHHPCPPGSGVILPGTPQRNTVCKKCPKGYFSSTSSAREPCTPHRNCSALGLGTARPGTGVRDAECEQESECFPLHGQCHSGAGLCEEAVFHFLVSQRLTPVRLQLLWEQLSGRRVERQRVEHVQKVCGSQQALLQLLHLWRESNRHQDKFHSIMAGVTQCERKLRRGTGAVASVSPHELRVLMDSLPGQGLREKGLHSVLQHCHPRQHLLQLLYTWRRHNPELDLAKSLVHSIGELRKHNAPRHLLKAVRSISKTLGTFSAHKKYQKMFSDTIKGSKGHSSASYNE